MKSKAKLKVSRADEATKTKRILTVLEMLLAGLHKQEIVSIVNKVDGLNWKLSDRQITDYIKWANQEIDIIAERNAEKTYRNSKGRLEYLYRKLINVKDYKGALMVIDKVNELDGLKIQKIAPVTPDGDKYEQSIDVTKLSTETLLELANASRKD